jgi:hypothetical protein
MNTTNQTYLPSNITKDQAKDTGMAFVLLCLILFIVFENIWYVDAAIILLLMNMIWPTIYRPFAYFWLGFSNIMGSMMSKLILSTLFFVLVTPVGLFRKIIGADSLLLKQWKKDNRTLFKNRNHKYVSKDMEFPF